MKPLNPQDVTWLMGTKAEIENLLQYEGDERILKLGHMDDVRGTLAITANAANIENIKSLLRLEKVPAAYVLIQGKLFGLITETVKEVIAQ
jgi:hypothetical protein